MEQNIPYLFAINIAICFVLSFILAKIYEIYGSAITYKSGFAKIFPIIAITTLIIISIVKTSIALSLGLVGALSIVRFRSAIKEPEELAYLFISIAIGLGLGANRPLYTTIGFVALVLVIIILGRGNVLRDKFNYYLIVRSDSGTGNREDLYSRVSELAPGYKLSRLEQTGDSTEIHFQLNLGDQGTLNTMCSALTEAGYEVSIIQQN